MSDPENFLARWSRLKREAALEEDGAGEGAPVGALQRADDPPTPAFDPGTLPAIDLIDAATDIRPFLEACVPEELARAALRRTWNADPAIRNFIGIAESQWDFNDPATIPGFGVHAAADYVCNLAAHEAAGLNTAVVAPAEGSPKVELPAASDGTCSDPAVVACEVTTAVTDCRDDADVGAGDLGPRTTGAHGGALPR
jgi:hypothetical protein